MKIRLPELVRQFCAEVLGTFLLVLFGDGAIAQVVLGRRNNLHREYCQKPRIFYPLKMLKFYTIRLFQLFKVTLEKMFLSSAIFSL